MARIAGVDLPQNKILEIGLTYIHGIGRETSKKIIASTKLNTHTRIKDLNEKEVKALNDYIANSVKVEGELKQVIFRNIKRLKDIRSYRGLRHKVGLPVRGQRTRKNARTRKGKNIAVGGLKRSLDKK
jgi:small subunit ribosomal protein S13